MFKKYFRYFVVCFLFLTKIEAQIKNNFISGEQVDYKISYQLFDAAYTSIKITEDIKNKIFSVDGVLKTTGTFRFFCAIDDKVNVIFNNETFKPIKFSKNISECGHINNITSKFDFEKKEVEVYNKEKNSIKKFPISEITKDIISSFYFLRNFDYKKIKVNDVIKVDMFIDEKIFPAEIKILGREIIKTKFGKIRAIKTKPIVEVGRVFKENDGLYTWVSDDENLIPLKTISELRVGKIKMSLDSYKNLKVPFIIIK